MSVSCVLKNSVYSVVSSVLLVLMNYIKSLVRVISVSYVFIDFFLHLILRENC